MSHELKVGDILFYKWGYDQTNSNSSRSSPVTEKTVNVQEIEAEAVTPEQNMSDQCVAKRDVFEKNSKPIRKVVQGLNQLNFDYGTAYLWDGKPLYRSWYA